MARGSINLTIEETVIESLDEFAQLAGLTRSAAANLILKGVLNEDPTELYATMVNALVDKGKQTEAKVFKEVVDSF